MDASTPTTEPYPLGNRIIHANIESIEPEGSVDEGRVSIGSSPTTSSKEDKDAKEEALQMKLWWQEAIAKNMHLPDGYQSVAVLIIKWEDELDELKTRAEATELETFLRERFHYKTDTVELNVSSKPQFQLERHLVTFVEKYDRRGNLLIVYYTGHGVYRVNEHPNFLELTASNGTTAKKGLNPEARANWNKAEELLRGDDVDSDVLTILDTCFSSNLAKSGKEDGRIYELLSACAFDATTASPGANSFTRALIDAMKELLDENSNRSFTTFQLNQRILLNPVRRETPSMLWYRLKHHDSHIRLAPLKPDDRERKIALSRRAPKGYLTLRFALGHSFLRQEQIEYLTQNLARSLNSKYFVPLHKIDWLEFEPSRTAPIGGAMLAIHACTQWKKFLKHRREERESQAVSRASTQMNLSPSPSSPVRKRVREEVDVGLEEGSPLTKRGLSVIPEGHNLLPSPPPSDSA